MSAETNDSATNQPAASSHVDWLSYEAVLFDLDGVITPTAVIHERAWAELFSPWGFTEEDYLAYVDGKPRYDGVKSYLETVGVELPWGSPDDAPGDDTICAMGNRKNDAFNAVLERDGIEPFPGSVALLELLDQAGIRQAIVSSSKNARRVLEAAGMGDRFPVVVDGIVAAEEQLVGKPDPAMFQRAADLLGIAHNRCVVVEDAVSGVAAGAGGDFGLVVGIDRVDNRQALVDAGADIVVDDLGHTLA